VRIVAGKPGRGDFGKTEADEFGDLFERHARSVFAFCARRTADLALAEDLTSVVFLEAWRLRRSTQIATAPDALPWLLGVANNVARNAFRSLRRHRAALRKLQPQLAGPAVDDDVVARAETERALKKAVHAIHALSEAEREVVVLVLWTVCPTPPPPTRWACRSERCALACHGPEPNFKRRYPVQI
jgi:RNA polymerase sigma-70 factor (ECF subfamily)